MSNVRPGQWPAPPVTGRVRDRPSLWDIPGALWAYGLLRSLAFVAPMWSENGRIGLGVLVVLALYVFVLRRSRTAWTILVVLDALSLVMLVRTWFDADDAPLAVPILAAAAMIALLMPSTRRWVSAVPAPPGSSGTITPTS